MSTEAGSITTRMRVKKRSWNMVKSGYHAFTGLAVVVHDAPSIQMGIFVTITILALGGLLGVSFTALALLALVGGILLATETLNTSIETLCDHLHPDPHPAIGKVKDIAAAATLLVEITGGLVVLLVLGPPMWHILLR